MKASSLRIGVVAGVATIALSMSGTPAVTPASAHGGFNYFKCQEGPSSSPLWSLCLEWTGGWPSGSVRAETGRAFQRLYLQTSTSWRGPFRTVASATISSGHNNTPSVRAGKYSWYRACAKVFPWSTDRQMYCMSPNFVVYLGD